METAAKKRRFRFKKIKINYSSKFIERFAYAMRCLYFTRRGQISHRWKRGVLLHSRAEKDLQFT